MEMLYINLRKSLEIQKFLQTDIIFFKPIQVPTIKFGKCFAGFCAQTIIQISKYHENTKG